MAFDRDEALRQAEKLVKLGRLDQALAEYQRVLAEAPDDWKTMTAAADLYLRANQPARATALFNRQADHLADQGFLPRAEAFYKRVLKIEPLNEHTLDRLAAIAIKTGISVEARAHLTNLVQARQARGDTKGAAAATLKIGTLDPARLRRPSPGRSQPPRPPVTPTWRSPSCSASPTISDAAERPDEAVDVLHEAVALAPADQALRERLLGVLLARGDRDAARECARTAEDWTAVAASDEQAGDLVQALTAVDQGLETAAEARGLGVLRARLLAALGDEPRAEEQLSSLGSVDDPELQRLQLEVWLKSGRLDHVRDLLSRWQAAGQLDGGPMARLVEALPAVEWPLAEFRADEALAGGDGLAAAAILKQFVAGHAGHLAVPDEAHRSRGRRRARQRENRSAGCPVWRVPGRRRRRRRAGHRRRSGGSRTGGRAIRGAPAAGARPERGRPRAGTRRRLTTRSSWHTGLSTLRPSWAMIRTAQPTAHAGTAVAPEIDLSAVIDGLKPHTLAAAAAQKGSSMPDRPDPSNLDDVFRDFRDEVSRQSAVDQAEQHYKVALTYRDMGMIDDAVRELEQAAKSPRLRFDASALLARLLRDRGDVASAVEWFERAAEAPAPTPEAGRQLLYELGPGARGFERDVPRAGGLSGAAGRRARLS